MTTHASPVHARALEMPPTTSSGCAYFSRVEPFGDDAKITLSSPNLRVELLTYGASILSVKVRDPRVAESTTVSGSAVAPRCEGGGSGADEGPNEWMEVCLGFDNPAECLAPGAPIGGTCGRFAGRIAEGEFNLEGHNYKLLQNRGRHTLHGGPQGFNKLRWKYLLSEGEDDVGVSFHLTSPHLDQGFPGELYVTATYSIVKSATAPATLRYVFRASLAENRQASATVVNMTNRTMWNLNGVPRHFSNDASRPYLPVEPVTNHCLQLHAKYFAETNSELIPTGNMVPTEHTVHDYTKLRCIEAGLRATAEQGRELWGYDDPVALETWDSTLREAAVLYSPKTKLQMRVCTTNPSITVHTANSLPEKVDGSVGQRFQRFSGIALECAYFPNSPNITTFPSTTLHKGETYSETTTHEFQFLNASPSIEAQER